MTDMYEPSTVVYTLNATLEISPGSNLTTNFTAYDIIETSPDKWHMGASFDKISKYDFYAYSKFENGVSVVNITAFNRTVNVHTSCAGTTPGIDWKYVPNNGACDHLQASIQVMNASGDVLTQDSGCIKYNYFDSGSYLYQNVDFQKVINVFPTAKTHQFLNCLTYNTQYNDEGSIKITNIPSNEPIFWLLDYTITDSFNDLLAETSGAIPLISNFISMINQIHRFITLLTQLTKPYM
uniref:Uncharacterized protein n=1 Tax=Acrobeloides nanus TaxID=290746 RepID=A0A914DAA3_9BILA